MFTSTLLLNINRGSKYQFSLECTQSLFIVIIILLYVAMAIVIVVQSESSTICDALFRYILAAGSVSEQ